MPNNSVDANDSVMAAFERFQAALMRVHVPHFLELNLTQAQLRTLYVVAAEGPLRMSEVAHRQDIAASTSTGVVDALVQLDLLERVEDPNDRRQVLVRTTPAGRERLDDFHELGRGRLRDMLARIDDPDGVATIERALTLLTDAAERLHEDSNE
ncbi:MAG TPA: MarR family transcriptional regulator [Candidatus Limnocylindria bacterium]|nr:MarR family transcriptional regulator [Candidatus Limnocylindria bacterium]